MNLMFVRNILKLIFTACLLVSLFSSQALAEARPGNNLYVFVFKDGLAQEGIEVEISAERQLTDKYGFAKFSLEPDLYEVEYKQNGEVFASTAIEIKSDIPSQIFLNLYRDGAESTLDLPIADYEQAFDVSDVKEMQGPKGKLLLTLLDKKTKEPVKSAKLFFRGYAFEAVSNDLGIVDVDIADNTYSVSIVHPEYVLNVIKDLKVAAGSTKAMTVELTKSEFLLDDYVVSAPFVEGSLASSIAAVKERDIVSESISSEQFSKSGDSSASGALARATGVTIVDGTAYIRGVDPRYSNVTLNGLNVPSSDPTRRLVSLDVFPSGVIESLDIQKTFSADVPGTFGGGAINIRTKDIPTEDNYIKGSVGLSFDSYLGDDAKYNPDNSIGVPNQILRFSDDFGVLTQSIPFLGVPGLTAEEKDELNRVMVNYRSYGLQERKIKPGTSFSLSSGQRFKSSEGTNYGFTAALNYKTSEEYIPEVKRKEFRFNPSTLLSEELTDSAEYEVFTIEESLNALVSLGLEPSKKHKYKYTFLFLDKRQDTTVFGLENDLFNNDVNERTLLQYTEESLNLHQFAGKHTFGEPAGQGYFDNIDVDWTLETATATRLEPGTFEYEYKEESDVFVLDAKKLFYLYSDLEDTVDNARVDFTIPYLNGKNKNYTKFGFFQYDKLRDLDNRRFKIKYTNTLDPSDIDTALSEANVDNGTIEVLDAYRPDDFYTAKQTVSAFYLSQKTTLFDALDITAGVRLESSEQSLLVGQDENEFKLETEDTLPALLASYNFTEEHRLRFAYSETISRPDFREFSPNRYKDPLTDNIVFGFGELESTKIENIDLVYEWFPNFDELYSVGLFVKNFDKPIEVVRSRADEDIEVSYRNAESAVLSGIDFTMRKNLESFTPRLKNYFVSFNHSIIDSEVSLDKDNPDNASDAFIADLTSDTRPLQGQSPYVTNLIFGYDNFFTKRSVIFLYNVFGERISELGIQGNPDIYEQPFEKLDMVIKWRLNDTFDAQEKKLAYSLSFKAENILDSSRKRTQGNETVLEYKSGKVFKLNFSIGY